MAGRVIVVGSVNVDLVVTAERLPGPGETVIGGRFAQHHGGKGGNQAVAAARLGARTFFIGAVGDDAFGRAARAALEAEGVDVAELLTLPDEPTGVALIVVDEGGRELDRCRRRRERGARLRPGAGRAQAARRSRRRTSCSSVTRSATGATHEALRVARIAGATTILNPAPAHGLERPTLELADILTPNQGELAALAGGRGGPSAQAKRLLGPEPGKRAVLVSLGANGTLLVDGKRGRAMAAPKVDVVDTVGAGDTLNGALAAGLAAGLDLAEAARRAGIAASLAVTAPGARGGMPTAAALEDALSPRHDAH